MTSRGRATHEVTNQPPPLQGYNLFEENRPLAEALRREGAAWAEPHLSALGKVAGTPEVLGWGTQANDHPPVLRTHDRFGNRIDEVDFHPAWHSLMRLAVEHGIHAMPWREPRPGAHAARAAAMILMSGVEAGHGCPISMTYAAVPALRAQPDLAAEWEPRLTSPTYDPRLIPAQDKAGALAGMAMTEKQGGSDVRANTTRAAPLGDGAYELTGHKWFCSAPMCDAFLVLAQAPSGLSCFFLPRVLPDGTRNAFHIQRLKDKLGNRSNASSEVEFDGAWARLVGEEGRGIHTIIEMVNYTRLDCLLGSTGLMRAAVAQATHHATYRQAFGNVLADQPLMRNVLADLCVESEAATLMAMRTARAVDDGQDDRAEADFRRLGVAVGKYWVCKSAVGVVGEALECLGGNGYVEESGMPRLYRETPLNSIWEGSGNVNALDVLRAIAKRPDALDAYLGEVELASDPRLDAFVAALKDELANGDDIETRARRVVEGLALALQGSLMIRYAPQQVADAFCASRLAGHSGRTYGTLPPGLDFQAIIERHRPSVAA
ncbi:MAG TPA: isovaleryl-CoA dehydrogenase [Actinomycetota bacterium]|nr:isovaleryl-CoA dehydrogenase [Actinomycetota bacterium]